MPVRFTLFSEKYQPEGGAGGDAARRALGRPKLDRLSVLVREAVQNSWDARKQARNRKTSIDFIARLGQFDEDQIKTLKDSIFRELPPSDHPLHGKLKAGLTRLIMEDRGTSGLGGPVFKERVVDPNEPRPFIRFFRDIGRAAGMTTGGGTYGYGKSVFFNASAAATIVVYTRFEEAGEFIERLMAMSLSSASKDEVLTGRHWWGVRQRQSVGPLSGDAAGLLAAELGFFPLKGRATGTAIMIVAPEITDDLNEDRVKQATRVAESMMFWYWPRMLGGVDGSGSIKFKVFADNKEIAVPDPETTAPFDIYSSAFKNLVAARHEAIRAELPNVVEEIRSERPAARLGWLSLSLAPRRKRIAWAATDRSEHPLQEQLTETEKRLATCHHVALIRTPGQVIRYLATKQFPDPAVEYAGVFSLDSDREEINQEFIDSEPPSHDDWVAPERGSNKRSCVRIAKARIRNKTEQFAASGRPPIDSRSQDALGVVSAELGHLISAPGTGAHAGEIVGRGRAGRSTRSAGRRVKVSTSNFGKLEERDGIRVFVLRFDLAGEIPENGTNIDAKARVIIAGGGPETDAPSSSLSPRVISWERRTEPVRSHRGPNLKVTPSDVGEWEVIVSCPLDAMISVSIHPEIPA